METIITEGYRFDFQRNYDGLSETFIIIDKFYLDVDGLPSPNVIAVLNAETDLAALRTCLSDPKELERQGIEQMKKDN